MPLADQPDQRVILDGAVVLGAVVVGTDTETHMRIQIRESYVEAERIPVYENVSATFEEEDI